MGLARLKPFERRVSAAGLVQSRFRKATVLWDNRACLIVSVCGRFWVPVLKLFFDFTYVFFSINVLDKENTHKIKKSLQ